MYKKYFNTYDIQTVPPPPECLKAFGKNVLYSPKLILYLIQQILT